jgi:transcriptional antiterminator NusG
MAQSLHLCQGQSFTKWGKLSVEWFALYVKSRHEYVTSEELKKKEIDTFLPSVKRWRQWKDRKMLVDFPLFPGYLFVHVRPDSKNFISVLKTRGAVALISSQPGSPTPVADEEIDSLRVLIASGKDLDIYPHLKEGDRVRIKGGPLKGAEGVLLGKGNQYMFLVNINLLGRSVGLNVYADDIEC